MIRCDGGGCGGEGPEGRAAPPVWLPEKRLRRLHTDEHHGALLSAITLSFDLITSIIIVVFLYDERPVCTLDDQGLVNNGSIILSL
jgi:hypothetical protein